MKFLLLALAITSRSVGSFIAIPEWMPTAVDSTHSIGSDDHAVPFRLSSEDQAAVEAIFDAYYERAFCFSDSVTATNAMAFLWTRDFGPRPVHDISDMSYLWVTNCGLSGEARASDARVFQYSWTTNDNYPGHETYVQRAVPDSRRMIEAENMVKVKDATIQMIRHYNFDFPYRGLPYGVSSYVYKSNAWGTVENLFSDGEELPNSGSPRVVLVGTSFLPGVDDLPDGGDWTEFPKNLDRRGWVSRMNKVFGETAVPYSALGSAVDPYIGVGGSCPGGFLYNVWCAVVAGSGSSFLFSQKNADAVEDEDGPFSWWYRNDGPHGPYGEYFNQGCTACEGSLSSVLLRLFSRADGSEYGGWSTYPEEGIYNAVVSQVPERRFTPDDYVTWETQETMEFVDNFRFGGVPQADGTTDVLCPTSIPVSSYVTIWCFPYPSGEGVAPISFSRDRETGRPRISGTVYRYRCELPSGDVIERGLSDVAVVMPEGSGWRDEFWGDDFEIFLHDLSDFSIVYTVSSPGVLSPSAVVWNATLGVYENLSVTTGVHKVMSQAALTSRVLALTDTVYEVPQVRGGGVGPSETINTLSYYRFTYGPTTRVARVKLDIDTMPKSIVGESFRAPVVSGFNVDDVYPELNMLYFYSKMISEDSVSYENTPDCNVRAAAGFSGSGYDISFLTDVVSDTDFNSNVVGLYGEELLNALSDVRDETMVTVRADWHPDGSLIMVLDSSGRLLWSKVVNEVDYLRDHGIYFRLSTYIAFAMESSLLNKRYFHRFTKLDNPIGPGTLSSVVGNRGFTKVYLPSYRLTMKTRVEYDKPFDWNPYASDIASIPTPRYADFDDTVPFTFKEESRHFVEEVEGSWHDVASVIDREYEGYEDECEKTVRELSGISEDDWGDFYKMCGEPFPLSSMFQGEFLSATTAVRRAVLTPHGDKFIVSGGVVYDLSNEVVGSNDVILAYMYFTNPPLVDHAEDVRKRVWKPAVLSAVRSVPVVETRWDWGAVKANENDNPSTLSLRVPSTRGSSRDLPDAALSRSGNSWRAVNRVRERSEDGGKSMMNVPRGSTTSPKPASAVDVSPYEGPPLPIAH